MGAAIFGADASTIEEAGIQFKQNAPSSPEYAAKTILKNVKKKNKRILIGFDAKFYDLMSRLFPKNFLKIINGATGKNNTTEVKLDKFVISENFNSGFSLDLMIKDVSIAEKLIKILSKKFNKKYIILNNKTRRMVRKGFGFGLNFFAHF